MALSDPQGILATPFTIINCKGEVIDIEAITSIIDQNQVNQVIVGLPYSMDGSLGKQAEKIQAFTRKLCHHIKVPVEFRDESLTTVWAKNLKRAAGVKKTRKKVRHDAMAAALILQGYLEEKREVGL